MNEECTKQTDSGQVFREFSCRGGPMVADWVWKVHGNTKETTRFRAVGPGCSSLVDMAVRTALTHSYQLTVENLEGLPEKLAGLLWRRITVSKLDSVKVWKAFTRSSHSVHLNGLDPSFRCKHKIIPRPNMRLHDYIKPIVSPNNDWITFLTLSHITCSRTELIRISLLTNLGALSIGPGVIVPDIGLDDGVVRTWARTAATSGLFRMLRVLSFRFQGSVTTRVFTYLNDFATLALFNVEGCDLGPQEKSIALSLGWKCQITDHFHDCLVENSIMGAGWHSIVQKSFWLGGALNGSRLTTEGAQAIDSLPFLHLCLGAVPPDPVLNADNSSNLRSFHRLKSVSPDIVSNHQESRLKSSSDGSEKVSNRRPAMRASAQRVLEDILSALG